MNEEDRRAKHTERMRRWRAAHPENREYQREYHARYMEDPGNLAANRERARKWYAENPEKGKERARAHYAAKPKKGRPTGEAHRLWKGDAAGYQTIHAWVVRHKGRPQQCEACGTSEPKQYDWANVDHQYRRVLEDWVRMCRSCHRLHDYGKGLSKKGGRRPRPTD